MMFSLIMLTFLLHKPCAAGLLYAPADTARFIVMAEQSQQRIVIADINTGQLVWEWKPAPPVVPATHIAWFSNPSDAKPVLNNQYLLMTASGGAVALLRIADKKLVFYAYAGGNTHSAEMLPDGNIVAASSTGNYLTVFRVDTLAAPADVYKKTIPIAFGHNVVWDRKRNLLWSAGMNTLISFRYNFNCAYPDLEPIDSVKLPGAQAHDLFPDYGSERLWLTNLSHVYLFDPATRSLQPGPTLQADIKSVSSAPGNAPTILIRPKEKWWTDEVLDANGKIIFHQAGWKIYKARWLLTNSFSYPPGDTIKSGCRIP